MRQRIVTLFSCFFLSISASFAQNSVSVNTLTGSANVVIPVYNLTRGAVSCPISLVYSSSGIKPKDVEGTAGMGWQLAVGGSVTRQVRGLPDDAYQDNAGNKNLVGWMYNSSGASSITGFTPANAGTGASCTNETSDITYINNHFTYLTDTEPDQFSVSAPGLSCQLYYDVVNSRFVTVPYQDLVITYTTDNNTADATYKQITSFTITNDQGIKYLFNVPESASQKAVLPVSGTAPNFLKSTYNQYKNGINYYDNWFLKSMTDANGNGILFTYTAAPARLSSDPVQLYVYNGTAYVQQLQYTIENAVSMQQLTAIQTIALNVAPQVFTLNWFNTEVIGTGQPMISTITGAGRYLSFGYAATTSSGSRYSRDFLTSFIDQGSACSSPINYQFSYNGVTSTTTTLPDSTSTQVDYWGYYSTMPNNGTLMPAVFAGQANVAANHPFQVCASTSNADYNYTIPGTNRAADPTVITTGQLSQITYAQGGNTTIAYEPNNYYDPTAGAVVYGGGVRVKQITDYDGISTANNIVRNYSYTDASGNSTGKPLTLPEYAFAIPYAGAATGLALMENSTALSAYDLSGEDHSIMYGTVTLSQTGIGKNVYQYYLTGMNWDNTGICYSCGTSDWAPSYNYAARTNCTPTYGPVKNSPYSYPFTPNTNYDFERGLLQKTINYDNNNNEVSESDYTYQRTGTPYAITGFRYDQNTNVNTIEAYAKYNIYTTTGELTTQAVKTVYNASVPITTTTSYTYGSVQHKLAQEQVTNSDGSTIITNMKYVKDYTVSSGSSDPNIAALYNLQLLNINAPVETYQQVQKGGTTLTTGAALTLFSNYYENGTNFYLPAQQLKYSIPAGAASFQPFAISAGVKSYDPNYVPAANFTVYDDFGILQTTDDAHKNVQTIITDHTSYHPVAIFKNAALGDVGFNDFDSAFSIPNPNFTFSGTPWGTPVGSHTGNAYGLSSSQTITTTVNRNSQASNYIVSIWINASAQGQFHITFTSPHQTLNYTESYGGQGGWVYYEWKLPVNTTDASIFVTMSSTTNIGIDDIMTYPATAEVSTFAYDANFHNTASTNTNGVSTYYNYDIWGRLLYVYDQDKNIVQKKTYITPADKQAFLNANSFTISGTRNSKNEYYINSPITFTAGSITSCNADGITYTWHFSDGPDVVTTTPALSHTFTSVGSKTVSLTTSSPFFGSETTTTQTIVLGNNVIVVANNSTTGATGFDDFYFYQGTTLLYTFTAAQVSGGATSEVPRGVYNITVAAHGPGYVAHLGTGYLSILMQDDVTSSCQLRSSGGSYTFSSVDLTQCTGLGFTMTINTCP